MRQHRYFPSLLYPVYSRFLRCRHGYIPLVPVHRSGTWWLSHLHLHSTLPYAHERTYFFLSPAAHLPMPYFPELSILPATSSSMPPLLFVYSSFAHLPFLLFILKSHFRLICYFYYRKTRPICQVNVHKMSFFCTRCQKSEDWRDFNRKIGKKGEPHLSRESHGTDGAPHTVWTQITIFIFESQLLRAIALPQLTTTFAIRATALLAHAV